MYCQTQNVVRAENLLLAPITHAHVESLAAKMSHGVYLMLGTFVTLPWLFCFP